MTSHTHKLLTITVHDTENGQWKVRSLMIDPLQEPVPTTEDFTYYYNQMLGIREFNVSLRVADVPNTFQPSMLGIWRFQMPDSWPQFDRHFGAEADLERYYTLVSRLVEMEALRSECGVTEGSRIPNNPSSSSSFATNESDDVATGPQKAAAPQSAHAGWIKSLLETLGFAEDFDDVRVERDSTVIAWAFTPLMRDIRDELGFRLISDTVIGESWCGRLGTALFPDVVVCHRISMANWLHQSDASRDMVAQIIRWFSSIHCEAPWEGALSPWILAEFSELMTLIGPFRNMIPRARKPQHIGSRRSLDKTLPAIIQYVEDTFLFPADTNERGFLAVIPADHQWTRLMYHYVREGSLGLLDYEKCLPFLEARKMEWIHGRRCLNANGPACFKKWERIWSEIMSNRHVSNAIYDRLDFFIHCLDAMDPVNPLRYNEEDMTEFMRRWVFLFFERELIRDTESRVLETPMHIIAERWIQQYLPTDVVDFYRRHSLLLTNCLRDTGFTIEKARINNGGLRVVECLNYRNVEAMYRLIPDCEGDIVCAKKSPGRPRPVKKFIRKEENVPAVKTNVIALAMGGSVGGEDILAISTTGAKISIPAKAPLPALPAPEAPPAEDVKDAKATKPPTAKSRPSAVKAAPVVPVAVSATPENPTPPPAVPAAPAVPAKPSEPPKPKPVVMNRTTGSVSIHLGSF